MAEVAIMKIEATMAHWRSDKKEDFNKDIFNAFLVHLSLITLFSS